MAQPQQPGYLFGGTPEDFATQQEGIAQAGLLNEAKLNPDQFGMFLAGKTGRQVGQTLGSMFGIEDPMIKRFGNIKRAEQAVLATGVKEEEDPVKFYILAASELRKVGENELASQAAIKAREIKDQLTETAGKEQRTATDKALEGQYKQTTEASKAVQKRDEIKFEEEKARWTPERKKLNADADKAVEDAAKAKTQATIEKALLESQIAANNRGGTDDPSLDRLFAQRFKRLLTINDKNLADGKITPQQADKNEQMIIQEMAKLRNPPTQGTVTGQLMGQALGAGGTPFQMPTISQEGNVVLPNAPPAGGGAGVTDLVWGPDGKLTVKPGSAPAAPATPTPVPQPQTPSPAIPPRVPPARVQPTPVTPPATPLSSGAVAPPSKDNPIRLTAPTKEEALKLAEEFDKRGVPVIVTVPPNKKEDVTYGALFNPESGLRKSIADMNISVNTPDKWVVPLTNGKWTVSPSFFAPRAGKKEVQAIVGKKFDSKKEAEDALRKALED